MTKRKPSQKEKLPQEKSEYVFEIDSNNDLREFYTTFVEAVLRARQLIVEREPSTLCVLTQRRVVYEYNTLKPKGPISFSQERVSGITNEWN